MDGKKLTVISLKTDFCQVRIAIRGPQYITLRFFIELKSLSHGESAWENLTD